METKKILGLIFSLVFVCAFAFVLSWGIINFNKVKEGMSGTQIYTNEDLEKSYEDGYNTALKDKQEYDELISSYRDTITTLTDNISQLNSQVSLLKNNIKDYENQTANLTAQKQNLETQVANLNQVNSLNEATISDLNSQKKDLELQVEELSTNKQQNEKRISDLQSQISNLNIRINELQTSNSNSTAQINSLHNQIVALTNEKTVLENDISNKNNQIISLNSQITNLQTLNSQLQTTNNLNLQTINDLNTQIDALTKQISDMSNQIQNNASNVTALNSKIAELEKSVAYYEQYIANLESENQVVATFEFNGSVYNIQILNKNDYASVSNPTSTDRVVFNGWAVDGEIVDLSTYKITTNTKFVADVTYKYLVKFSVNDEIVSTSYVIENQFAIEPEQPTMEGYDFDGWMINNNLVDVSSNGITQDTIYTAKFTKLHTIYAHSYIGYNGYTQEDSMSEPVYVRDGECVSFEEQFGEPINFNIEFYQSILDERFNNNFSYKSIVCKGFSVNGGEIIDSISTYPIYEDTIFKTINTFYVKINFIVDEELFSEYLYELGTKFVVPNAPTKENYEFIGWAYSSGNLVDFAVLESELDLFAVGLEDNIYAKYEAFRNVEFVVDNNVISSQKIQNNRYTTIPTSPTKEGYVFDGWTVNGEVVDVPNYLITADTTFVAKFTKLHTVKLMDDYVDHMTTTLSVKDGSTIYEVYADEVTPGILAISSPEDYYLDNLQETYNEYFGSYKGYNFIKVYGWFVNNTEEIVDNPVIIPIHEDITYSLKWEHFTLFELIVDNETYGFVYVNYETQEVVENTITGNPTKENFEFVEWALEGEYQEVGLNKMVAVFEPYPVVQFKVDDTVISTQNIQKNNFATLPTEPTKEGYFFNGWTVNGELVDVANYPITSNTIFVADMVELYNVTFVNQGNVYSTQTVSPQDNLSIPNNPSHSEYIFMGWSENNNDVVDLKNYKVNKDTTFTALFGEYAWTETDYIGLSGITGSNIWTDGVNTYYSSNEKQYVFNEETNSWVAKTWNGLTSFSAMRIWKDNGIVYYSDGDEQYVLNKETSTWEPKTWNGLTSFYSFYTWTDGTAIYYSKDSSNQYVLNRETSTWISKTWNGYTSFAGTGIWSDGTNTYYSNGSAFQYVLNKSTSTWTTKTWTGCPYISPSSIWTDGTDFYYSDNSTHYVLQKGTSNWVTKTWNGLDYFSAGAIWTVGDSIYLSAYSDSDSDQYVLDKDTYTWIKTDWNIMSSFNGNYIWKDGSDIYYSYYSAQYIFDKEASTWIPKVWNGFTDFSGSSIWTDGINIYSSNSSHQYFLDRETETWVAMTWNGFTDLRNGNTWSDGTNIYYSYSSNQYVLDKATSTWVTKTWNGDTTKPTGSNIWTDGENIYYSSLSKHYVLDVATSTWTTKTWTGLTRFSGSYIWTDGTNIYYSEGSSQYTLDKATSTWVYSPWDSLSDFTAQQIWFDGEYLCYSKGLEQYKLALVKVDL